MTYTELLNEIHRSLKNVTEKPKCFEDENFLYCFCGKCKQKDYPLPKDFNILNARYAAEYYINYYQPNLKNNL